MALSSTHRPPPPTTKLMGKDKKGRVRFRVFFDDRCLLNNSQLSDGLGRCWLHLKPSIATFADLASHLRKKFAIRDRLVLFIDDFVLPPFESTCIIKNKDIIRVKQKNVKLKDVCKPGDGQNTVQDPQITRTHGLSFNSNVMADEKSQANSQGNGSNETAVHDCNLSLGIVALKQKREHSLELHNSMRKRQKPNCTEKQVTSVCVQDMHSSQNGTFCHVSGGSKMDLHAKDNTHDDGLVVALAGSEGLGEPSSSMPCKERQQSDGIGNGFESEPHIACDVTKENAKLSYATSKKDQNQFREKTFKGRNYCSDFPKKKSSRLCIENRARLDRMPKGDSPDKNAKAAKHTIDFASLFPLTRLPLKGDILAYRYVEPSSTVYPELSSPRVGKVSAFDNKSSEIVLIPAPEFEVFSKENLKIPISLQRASPCKDDLLEIKLSALFDVRLLKAHNSKELACLPEGTLNGTKKDNWEVALAKSNWNQSDAHHSDKRIGWDSWIPNKSSQSNIFPRGRVNEAKYTKNERRAPTSWINGASPAAAFFWETVLSKGTYGEGGKCSGSGKY